MQLTREYHEIVERLRTSFFSHWQLALDLNQAADVRRHHNAQARRWARELALLGEPTPRKIPFDKCGCPA